MILEHVEMPCFQHQMFDLAYFNTGLQNLGFQCTIIWKQTFDKHSTLKCHTSKLQLSKHLLLGHGTQMSKIGKTLLSDYFKHIMYYQIQILQQFNPGPRIILNVVLPAMRKIQNQKHNNCKISMLLSIKTLESFLFSTRSLLCQDTLAVLVI